jgi:hypothetical protein
MKIEKAIDSKNNIVFYRVVKDEQLMYVYRERVEHRTNDDLELLHRTDGPAVWYKNNGIKKWYLNGKLHREDGPAWIYNNGREDYYLNGKYLPKEDYEIEVKLVGKTAAELTKMFVEIAGQSH